MPIIDSLVHAYSNFLRYAHHHLLLVIAAGLALVFLIALATMPKILTWLRDDEIIGHVGTLSYTRRTLFMVFAWLLWGDFCVQIMWQVFPSITPVTMQSVGSNNALIGLVCTTIPNILNLIICPWVSFKSDRHRSKWGRRRPFMLLPTAMITIFLVLIGVSPDIGRHLHAHFVNWHFSQSAMILTLIAVFSVGFGYFNMFIDTVYWYLFNDVVPDVYLGRFVGLFRVVANIATAGFNFMIFPLIYTHSNHVDLGHVRWIFIGCGLLYLVGFSLMTINLREGEYPPPPENVDGQVGIISSIKTYFVECFSHRFYLIFYMATTFVDLVACIAVFEIFLQNKSLGLSGEQVGIIRGTALLLTAVLAYPAGMLSDKFHPIRTTIYGLIALVILTPSRLLYLFYVFTPQTAYKIEFGLQMLLIPATSLLLAAKLPMYMRLLPSERYGQYCAAQGSFKSLVAIVFGLLAGVFMDLMAKVCAHFHMVPTYYYKFVPIWTWACYIGALILTLMVYRSWKTMGGDKHYVPPAVGCVAQGERALTADNV